MAGKQARLISSSELQMALREARRDRYPLRDRAIILLSAKAGLRAGEIANLTWSMVLTASGAVGHHIALTDRAAKKRSGRTIPMHPDIRNVLVALRRKAKDGAYVIRSERGEHLRPTSVVNWFASLYSRIGLEGCSSHSGRRSFVTRAARLISRVGGSLRDVQQLAGHKSLNHTQCYIEGDSTAKRRVVALL